MKMKSLITILAILSSAATFGQKNVEFPSFEKFYSSFGEHFRYPDKLQNKLPSTVTLMKINFVENGEVQSIGFSDNTLPQFVDVMQNIKNKLDFKSIYEDIKGKKKTTEQVLIPIQIDYEKIGEWQSEISTDNIKKTVFFRR